jgi:sulfonate transport system permease protein
MSSPVAVETAKPRRLLAALVGVTWQLILPLLLVIAYQLWASSNDNGYFPTIPGIVEAFRENWLGDGFKTNVLPSLSNLARGYGIGLLLGISVGVLLGRVPLLRRAFGPVFGFLLAVPPVAVLPLFLLVLGVGSQMQIGVLVFSVSIYMLISTADGIRSIEPTLDEVAQVYGIRGPRRLFLVVLPAASPQILAAARISLSLSVLVMVVSEMVGASKGIGAVTLLAQQSFAYEQMWAGMVLVAILGIGLNALFGYGERLLLKRAGLTRRLAIQGGK